MWVRVQAAKYEQFENSLVCAAENASDEVLNKEYLPKWAWRAIPGVMRRIGDWVHRDLVTEPRIDALLTEQTQMHAWIQVSLYSMHKQSGNSAITKRIRKSNSCKRVLWWQLGLALVALTDLHRSIIMGSLD